MYIFFIVLSIIVWRLRIGVSVPAFCLLNRPKIGIALHLIENIIILISILKKWNIQLRLINSSLQFGQSGFGNLLLTQLIIQSPWNICLQGVTLTSVLNSNSSKQMQQLPPSLQTWLYLFFFNILSTSLRTFSFSFYRFWASIYILRTTWLCWGIFYIYGGFAQKLSSF